MRIAPSWAVHIAEGGFLACTATPLHSWHVTPLHSLHATPLIRVTHVIRRVVLVLVPALIERTIPTTWSLRTVSVAGGLRTSATGDRRTVSPAWNLRMVPTSSLSCARV